MFNFFAIFKVSNYFFPKACAILEFNFVSSHLFTISVANINFLNKMTLYIKEPLCHL